ncbi:MAG TPA: substrate-binding domain-containing protein [Cytophagaceae bacterium]|jgi:D-xylose transport system substrate-binding protein|nr:substrate-binding domain-containing protein [Cytophagaceae bacterium]
MKIFIVQLILLIIQLGLNHSLCAQNKKTIGFLMDDFNSSRWKHDSAIFAKKVRASGDEIMIRVCDSDTSLQRKQANELINAKVDVIVLVPADAMAAKIIVDNANSNNIPIIAYDRLILNCNLDYFISFDGEKVGELQAEYILKKINYSGKIMLMNGPENDVNSLLFRKGQMKILQPYIDKGTIKVVYDRYLSEWTSMEAYMEGNDFFAKYNGPIDGIIAANDELAQGIIEALTVFRASEKIPVTGQDATISAYYNILDNLQGMTVYKPIDSIASQAAELAHQIARKEKVKAKQFLVFNGYKNIPFIKLQPIAITKENIRSLLVESNYLSEEYLKNKR